MELIEIAVLLGTRSSHRKAAIAVEAQRFVAASERELLKVVDKLTASGLLMNQHLGEYQISPEGYEALAAAVTPLEKLSSEIRYGSGGRR